VRLADLPRTVVIGGKRPRVRRVRLDPMGSATELQARLDACREALGAAQELYRETLGVIVLMCNPKGVDARRMLERTCEIGREFLTAAGARRWERPSTYRHRPLPARRRKGALK